MVVLSYSETFVGDHMKPWWYVHAELQHDGVSVVRTLPAAPPSLPVPKLPLSVAYFQDKASCSQDALWGSRDGQCSLQDALEQEKARQVKVPWTTTRPWKSTSSRRYTDYLSKHYPEDCAAGDSAAIVPAWKVLMGSY